MTIRELFPAGLVLPSFDEGRDIQIVRTRPRVYLHRLAQIVGADPSKRRRMLLSEKYPSPYLTGYEPVKQLAGEALRLGWDQDQLYSVAGQRWWAERLVDTRAQDRRWHALDAVEELGHIIGPLSERLARRGAGVVIARRAWEPIRFSSVAVADEPTLLLEETGRAEPAVGIISFHVSKTRPHTADSIELASVLLHELARRNYCGRDGFVSRRLCIVVDVFANLVADADRGHKRRLRQARLACEEIAALWPSL